MIRKSASPSLLAGIWPSTRKSFGRSGTRARPRRTSTPTSGARMPAGRGCAGTSMKTRSLSSAGRSTSSFPRRRADAEISRISVRSNGRTRGRSKAGTSGARSPPWGNTMSGGDVGIVARPPPPQGFEKRAVGRGLPIPRGRGRLSKRSGVRNGVIRGEPEVPAQRGTWRPADLHRWRRSRPADAGPPGKEPSGRIGVERARTHAGGDLRRGCPRRSPAKGERVLRDRSLGSSRGHPEVV